MKYEIVRKAMVLERVEFNQFKMHITTRSRICRGSLTCIFNKFQSSKWKGYLNLAKTKITEGYGNFSNSANMDRL